MQSSTTSQTKILFPYEATSGAGQGGSISAGKYPGNYGRSIAWMIIDGLESKIIYWGE